MSAYSYSESHAVRTVLLQPPFEVQPIAMSIFMGGEEPYLPRLANAQMIHFMQQLRATGAELVTLREALLLGTLDEEGSLQPGAALNRLIELASASIHCDDPERLYLANESLREMHPEDLVDLIFEQPTLRLVADPELCEISPDSFYEEYVSSPLFGLMFVRDHFIITNRGVIMGHFRRQDRRRETPVVRLALQNLGLEPVYHFGGDSFLEGGDFTTTCTISFIANGLRTNAQTVQTMLEQDLFGTEFVVVMHDELLLPEEFHLDHYFNILDEQTVMLSEERLCKEALHCSLYQRREGGYELLARHLAFQELAERLDLHVVSVQGKRMAVNFLNIGDKRLFCTQRMDSQVQRQLRELGYSVSCVPFEELHKQYGSLHCATQTIGRSRSPGGPKTPDTSSMLAARP